MNNWRSLRQAIATEACVLCGGPAADPGLCDGCHGDLPWLGTCCAACGVPLAGPGLCGRCRRDGPFPYPVTAVLGYVCPVDALVRAFKFHKGLVEGRVLGALFAEGIPPRLESLPDLLVPVPLHPERLRQRGFNQARMLARALGNRLGVEVGTGYVQRVRETSPQSGMAGLAGRLGNVRGAFRVTGDVRGRCVAMVDDVVTSGATMRTLGDALRRGGAERVEAYCCARTRK